MDHQHIQTPRYKKTECHQDEIEISHKNSNQMLINLRQDRFRPLSFSNIKQTQQSEKNSLSSIDNSQISNIYGRISPLSNRAPKRSIFHVDDLSKYKKNLDLKLEKSCYEEKKQTQNKNQVKKDNQNTFKSNSKLFWLTDDDHQQNIFQTASLEITEQKIQFNVNTDLSQINKSRKRLPRIEQKKPVFKKFIPSNYQQIQSQPKIQHLELIEIDNLSSHNFLTDNKEKSDKKHIICFHCGGSHYANQCSQQNSNQLQKNAKMKCFNCKKYGHTAKFCGQKWRCTICQSTEHFAKDCPLVGKDQKVCRNCLQPGHFAKQCKKQTKCFQCQENGHQKKDCPKNHERIVSQMGFDNKKEKTCFNCKGTGHYANDCKKPITCHKCGNQGHYSRQCPHTTQSFLSRNYGNTKDLNESNPKKAGSSSFTNIMKKK